MNHPTSQLLKNFATGDLDDQLSLMVSAHLGYCSTCKNQIQDLEEQTAKETLSESRLSHSPDFKSMEADILSLAPRASKRASAPPSLLSLKGKTFELPPSLRKAALHTSTWKSILGNISYARVQLNGQGSMYFVHFEKGSKIPEHTHDANEYAFVVAGSFSDTVRDYLTGDFARFTPSDSHHPYTDDPDGCLLLVSVHGPFVFKEGMAQALNPLRKLFFKWL